MQNVITIDHPLLLHKLSLLRKKSTTTPEFRNIMREMAMLMAFEVTRDLPLTYEKITTPIGTINAPLLSKDKTALISILRAGNGILDGFLQVMPTAKVGHVGLYRDTGANSVIEYYFKIPEDITSRSAIILDPMLATGQSAAACVSRLKQNSPKSIELVCILSAPEGIDYFHSVHPDVTIYTVAIDEKLNEKKYIVPGLGDAGDRLFGTQ